MTVGSGGLKLLLMVAVRLSASLPKPPRGEDLGAQSFARTLAASLSLQLHCTNRVTKRKEFNASFFLYIFLSKYFFTPHFNVQRL